MLEFGTDGYLYVSLGDGGGANDQFGNGQRTDTLLGTILRLDVDGAAPYSTPPDNPFVGGGGAPDVWAFGLRNPWRFDIDPLTGLMFVADVGQAEWEEVTVVDSSKAGANFGWSIVEADECFAETPCETTGLEQPVIAYDHSEGCSIIGGFVYRGALIPEVAGHYFYSDWCGGWVRSFLYNGTTMVEAIDWTTDLGTFGLILSFGRDGAGELYLLGGDGVVSRIVAQR
jgi:glucose/arabinose dehydrogenase